MTRICALVLLAVGQAGLAAAQTVPTSFSDLTFVVGPGDRVMVVDQSGIETIGRISELDASGLTIRSDAGNVRFREEDVVLIRQRKQDSARNGMIIGAAIGGGLGLLSELSCGGNVDYCGRPGILTLATTMWGIGVGVVADVLHKTPRDIYRHGGGHEPSAVVVAPLVGPHAAGAQLALRW